MSAIRETKEKMQGFIDDNLTMNLVDNIVVIVGAGASVASGLSAFRGKGGMYENKRPEELASRSGFSRDPLMVWSWYKARLEMMYTAEPNDIHHSLVRLEKSKLLKTVITQNVDGLHRRAGQTKLVEIHGTAIKTHCFDDCGERLDLDGVPENIPIPCKCGSLQRPSVVWFGETIDYSHLEFAEQVLRETNLLITVGTSGMVYPVAQFPLVAKYSGAMLVDFNIDYTAISELADIFVQGPAESTLPYFIDLLIEEKIKSQ